MNRRELLVAAATPLLLGLAPPRARAGGGTPLALVTADLEAAIVAIDLSTGRVHRRLATPEGPRSIESSGDEAALVAHTESGRLSVVEARTLKVFPVEDAFAEPRYAAIEPSGRLAYVTDWPRLVARRPLGACRVAWRGDPRILVIGCIHGDECEGIEVTKLLERSRPHPDFWLVHQAEPGRLHEPDAWQRSRRRPQPRLPRRDAAGDTDRPQADPAAAARRDDLVPPATGRRARMGAELRGRAPVCPAGRSAVSDVGVAAGKRVALAERAGPTLVRGRARPR